VFEVILGLPAHPLLIHAAVVFVPLQVASALVYAFVPFTRRRIRWFVWGILFVAPGCALLAKLSGDAFRARLVRRGTATPQFLPQIDQHRSYGTTTLYWTLGLSVLILILLLADRVAAGASPRLLIAPNGSMPLGVLLAVLVVVVAVATGYYIFKTGDTGGHMVWQSL
jgi:Predicted membrane protein (DUF2231)